MVWPLDDIVELGQIIADVATSDPLSFVLVFLGTVVMLGSMIVFGYLSVAGVVAPVITLQRS